MQPNSGDTGTEVLFGISFDGLLRAQEFLMAMTRISAEGHLGMKDAVLVVKDDDGKVHVRETVDPQPVRSAASGAMLAGLLGLMIAGPVGWLAGLGIGAGAGAATAHFVGRQHHDERSRQRGHQRCKAEVAHIGVG